VAPVPAYPFSRVPTERAGAPSLNSSSASRLVWMDQLLRLTLEVPTRLREEDWHAINVQQRSTSNSPLRNLFLQMSCASKRTRMENHSVNIVPCQIFDRFRQNSVCCKTPKTGPPGVACQRHRNALAQHAATTLQHPGPSTVSVPGLQE
jgi:hypothetical protein